MMKMKVKRKKTTLLVFMLLMLTNAVVIGEIVKGQVKTAASLNWPGDSWVDTDPADQGMNNSTIYDMYDYIDTNSLNVHSVSIVRNGFLVHEEYLINNQLRSGDDYGPGHPGDQVINETLHVQYSATKTIIGLLIGIAIDKGFIDNVSQTFESFFPELTYLTNQPLITIEHLLTMMSGIYGDGSLVWDRTLQEILVENLWSPPGTTFEYSSTSTHLLSAIINRTYGEKTSEFAQDNLFDPIGISRDDWAWQENSEGYSFGGYGLWFTPQAMSRIGLLMLNNGNWNGTQVISENWMIEMGTPHSPQGYYGYLVWMTKYAYAANGLGGQVIFIIPEHNMTVIFTAAIIYSSPDPHYIYIIDNFIIGAIVIPQSPDPGIPGYSLIVFIPMMIVGIVFISKKMKNKSSQIVK